MNDRGGVPLRSDPRWDMVAAGRISGPWTNLAMKIMMARIAQEIANDKAEANIRRCGDQIFEFYQKNKNAAAKYLHVVFRG